MRVIVVGAGISGLVAAWTARSHDVTVLDASGSVGGRMQSETVGGSTMELGAQFLSSRYTVVPQLAAELGLTLSTVAPGTALVHGGRLRAFRSDRPLSQFTSGVLPWRAAPRAGAGLARLASLASGRGISDPAAWVDVDHEPGSEWARRFFGAALADGPLAATINGFYFQSLSQSSGALPAAVMAFGVRPGHTLTLDGGLGQLTRALAARLDVRLGSAVRSVRREGTRAVVTTDSGEMVADRVVLAVPGPAARSVLLEPTDMELDLMSTPYSTGVVVGVPLPRPLPAERLGNAYGVLVHPDEPSPLAAVAVASRAHPDGAETDLLTAMFRHQAASALLGADDLTIGQAALESLAALEPPLRDLLPHDPRVTVVVRHRDAMPLCQPGHASAVAAYRANWSSADPVILAGDYLGFPWTDSAAATGAWAAQAALTVPAR